MSKVQRERSRSYANVFKINYKVTKGGMYMSNRSIGDLFFDLLSSTFDTLTFMWSIIS